MPGDCKNRLEIFRFSYPANPPMVIITLPTELEEAVAAEAERRGTTTEQLSLDALQERFLVQAACDRAPLCAAASLQPMDLSDAEAASLQEAIQCGAARPKIRVARLPEYQG